VDVDGVTEQPVIVLQLAVAQVVVSVLDAEIVLHSCVQTGAIVVLHATDDVANFVDVAEDTDTH